MAKVEMTSGTGAGGRSQLLTKQWIVTDELIEDVMDLEALGGALVSGLEVEITTCLRARRKELRQARRDEKYPGC